jgi:putative transposase
MEIQRNKHHVFGIMYHFVWIPKYRRKVFKEPYRTKLKEIIAKICYDYNLELTEIEIPEDHIHAIIRCEPKISPSDIMRILKSISAREFFKIYPDVRAKYFWGGKLWTQSYFVETVGNTNDKVIREYVKNQLSEMDKLESSCSLFFV